MCALGGLCLKESIKGYTSFGKRSHFPIVVTWILMYMIAKFMHMLLIPHLLTRRSANKVAHIFGSSCFYL